MSALRTHTRKLQRVFVVAGGAKLAGVDIMVQKFDLVGLGHSFRILVGSLEIIGGLCLLVPRTGVLGATLVACAVAGFLSAAIGHGVPLASRLIPTSREDARILGRAEDDHGPARTL
jgi:putative oxidoreductase